MSEYKRLTRKNEKGEWIAEVGHYEIYIDHEAHANVMHGDIIDCLAELEDMAEKVGKHSLPVGIGNIVYYAYHDGDYAELIITQIAFEKSRIFFTAKDCSGFHRGFTLSDFGSRIFLTEEEAQKKSEEWRR